MTSVMQPLSIQMSREEASNCLSKIKKELDAAEFHYNRGQSHYDRARQYIWNLHEYEGWKGLGYESWAQCVQTEFKRGRSILYKQLAAALVENQVCPNLSPGTISERVLRPLTKRKLTEDTRKALFELASKAAGSPLSVTSSMMNAAVECLTDALVTGTTQDENGDQNSVEQMIVFKRIQEDILARTNEAIKRQREHIQGHKAGVKILSSVLVMPRMNGRYLSLEIPTQLSTQEMQLINDAIDDLKVSLWAEKKKT